MTGRRNPLAAVPGLLLLAESQCYVVRRSQLLELGVTRHHVRAQLGALRWCLLDSQVVMLHTGTPTTAQKRWAAVLQCGTVAVLGGLSALAQGGLQGWDRQRTHVLVPAGVRPRAPAEVTLHTTHSLEERDVDRRSGCPATLPARSAIDAARWSRSPREAAGVIMAVVQQGLATPDGLEAALARFDKVKQQVAIEQAINDTRSGHDSVAEADVARLVVRAGLPAPRAQGLVITSVGPRRMDLVVDLPDGQLLVLEIDGPHHADPAVRANDAAKDAAVLADGHRVLRIPLLSVRTRPESIVRQLTAIRLSAEHRAQRPA